MEDVLNMAESLSNNSNKKAKVAVYPNDKIYAFPRSIADKRKFCLAELS
jgi:hypothetical protein